MDLVSAKRQISLLHDLPMTSLESHLKRCKLNAMEQHKKVLTGDEMMDYIRWMYDSFGKNSDLKFLTSDISVISGGTIAKNVESILKNDQKEQAIDQLNGIFSGPAERHFFSENQSISCGRFLRHMPAYWQSSDCFEIYYVFSGQCPVWFEGETRLLLPGNVLLIPPGIRKACKCPEDNSVMFFYMIRSSTFSQVFWEQLSSQNLMGYFFRNALNESSGTSYLYFETDCDPGIEMLLYSVFEQYNSVDKYRISMINTLMRTFFVALLQNYEHTAQVSKQNGFHWKPEFTQIFTYIQDHYQTVTLKELSRVFNYSERQLIRIIKNSTSKTFSELLTQFRMEKAAAMLSTGNYSIEKTAAKTGYSSLGSFYRVFTEHYGLPPVKWLKERLRSR